MTKLSAHRCFAIAVFTACLFFNATEAAEPQEHWDPIFDLQYDPSVAHFSSIDAKDLLPACQKQFLEFDQIPKTLTLYAQYQDGDWLIYIAGPDDGAGAFKIRGGECHASPPLIALVRQQPNPPAPPKETFLTEAQSIGLFKDALVRHEAAFGGKAAFLNWLIASTDKVRAGCKGLPEISCPPTYRTLPRVLQDILEQYRKT